jgi:hypothetical protein
MNLPTAFFKGLSGNGGPHGPDHFSYTLMQQVRIFLVIDAQYVLHQKQIFSILQHLRLILFQVDYCRITRRLTRMNGRLIHCSLKLYLF